MLFNALIRPYFMYGIELWYTSNKCLRGMLDLLLRHCLRIIINDVGRIPVCSNVHLHLSLSVLPLYAQFQFNLAQMIFKALNWNTCPPVREILDNQRYNQSGTSLSLRARDPFRIPLFRQESCRACLMFYGCCLWNHLQPDICGLRVYSSFITAYRDYLLDSLATNTAVPCPVNFYDFR